MKVVTAVEEKGELWRWLCPACDTQSEWFLTKRLALYGGLDHEEMCASTRRGRRICRTAPHRPPSATP